MFSYVEGWWCFRQLVIIFLEIHTELINNPVNTINSYFFVTRVIIVLLTCIVPNTFFLYDAFKVLTNILQRPDGDPGDCWQGWMVL